uniref:Uncharacterized protein n=1 Tax=Zea mays TaxID=4577 RepID=B6TW50_MAIZE|nr:hypothetical protein [Zea mays]
MCSSGPALRPYVLPTASSASSERRALPRSTIAPRWRLRASIVHCGDVALWLRRHPLNPLGGGRRTHRCRLLLVHSSIVNRG